MLKEKWKIIPSYDKLYEASNLGRIRRKDNKRIVKQDVNKSGYCFVRLPEFKRRFNLVHRLVLFAFAGLPRKYGKNLFEECRHIDGNKRNNNIDNLKWNTKKRNLNDERWYKIIKIIGPKDKNGKLETQAKIRVVQTIKNSLKMNKKKAQRYRKKHGLQ